MKVCKNSVENNRIFQDLKEGIERLKKSQEEENFQNKK